MTSETFERELMRALRRLSRGDAWLAPLDAESHALKVRGKKMATRVSGAIVREMAKRGWLRPRGSAPGEFLLSEAGEGVFLRAGNASDPFAAQHQLRRAVAIQTHEGTRDVIVNEGESPIGWLRQRRIIDAVQFDAGERLRRDFTLAQLTPRLGVDWSAPVVLGSRGANAALAISDTALAAKERFRKAMKSVGPGLSDLLFDICCHLIGLEEAERALGWPRRSAKIVLQIALDRLADHYGMRGVQTARVRAWREEKE